MLTNGIPVCSETGDQWAGTMLTGSNGVSLISWWDSRGANNDLYAQRVNALGDTLWAANGIPVCTENGEQTVPDAHPDGFGGMYVTWQDSRGGLDDVYVQRVDSSGASLWTVNGVAVCTAGDNQQRPFLTSDGAGGTIITWNDNRGGDLDVYVQRVDPSGIPLWKKDGVAVCTGANNQYHINILPDGAGGAILTWMDNRSANFDIYAQRIRESGYYGVEPYIMEVMDVPADQGGKIQLRWWACAYDTLPGGDITEYSLWRRLPFGGQQAEVILPGLGQINGLRTTSNGWVWEWLANVPARYFDEYAYTAVSLSDSMGFDPRWQYFMVTAHTAVQSVFYDSPVDSGYSVDNLSPCTPGGLAAEQSFTPAGLNLTWDANLESDFHHYAVYRGLSDGFVPGPGNRVAEPSGADWFDDGWTWDSNYYYKVSALDVHGNESGWALLRPEDVTGIDTPKVPFATYLGQNYPNPFHPMTHIEFGLKSSANISLRIFDAAGRLVRVLYDGPRGRGRYVETWDGYSNQGNRVASGIYFYRLNAGAFSQTRKMVLLK